MTDVGTTPRKPLTPTQRLALFERCKGICCICKRPIAAGEAWIDEHLRALGLGGSNDPENRGIAHEACAHGKTHGPEGDLARIARAKRKKMAALGIKRVLAKPIRSAPFPQSQRAADRAARGPKQSLPIRLPPGFVPASSHKETAS